MERKYSFSDSSVNAVFITGFGVFSFAESKKNIYVLPFISLTSFGIYEFILFSLNSYFNETNITPANNNSPLCFFSSSIKFGISINKAGNKEK
jgi:hypothetical protein